MEKEIINKLLMIIEQYSGDDTFKDMLLFPVIKNIHDVNVYHLIVKGERDNGNPFYCGSTTTHIVEENYCDGKLVYASIVYTASY